MTGAVCITHRCIVLCDRLAVSQAVAAPAIRL